MPEQLFLNQPDACGCGWQYTPESPARRMQWRQKSKRRSLLEKSLPEQLFLEQLLKLPVPSLHLIMGNVRRGRKFNFGRQQISDPDRNTNEVSTGYQQIQKIRRGLTGECRAKSKHGKIKTRQNRKTQRDPECGATPRQTQEAGKEQQGKEQAGLNHSRAPVDDEYTCIPFGTIAPGRIDGKQNTRSKQQTGYALQRTPCCHSQKLGFTKQIPGNLVNHPEAQNDANQQRHAIRIRILFPAHALDGIQREQRKELGKLVKHIKEKARESPVQAALVKNHRQHTEKRMRRDQQEKR